jgi:hypothetical protein
MLPASFSLVFDSALSGSATYASSSIMKRICKGQNARWICLMLYKWRQFNLSGSYYVFFRKEAKYQITEPKKERFLGGNYHANFLICHLVESEVLTTSSVIMVSNICDSLKITIKKIPKQKLGINIKQKKAQLS